MASEERLYLRTDTMRNRFDVGHRATSANHDNTFPLVLDCAYDENIAWSPRERRAA
jgi:hypothetical protein